MIGLTIFEIKIPNLNHIKFSFVNEAGLAKVVIKKSIAPNKKR